MPLRFRLRSRTKHLPIRKDGRLKLALLLVAIVAAACGRPPKPPTTRQNVVLITIDTVRADHLGAYGASGAETPNLDRIAREGIVFDNAESCVPLTLPSHATILTGLLPPHHGVRANGRGGLPADVETLATRLAAAGYRTGAFVGAFVLDHRFGLARGFETYDDEIARDPSAPGNLEAERSGAVVVDRALSWMAKKDTRPFFVWIHLYDAHAPYRPPEPFASRHADHPYDGAIAFVDFQVGRVLGWLDARGHAGDTAVAVAADHGESLGEHGELTHGFFLYEATLHVPLLLRDPRLGDPGRRVRTPVSLADLAPTLAGIVGRPFSPTAHLDGRDLSGALLTRREPAGSDLFAETQYPTEFGWAPLSALRRANLKYIEAPRPELYDLSSDANEVRNLLVPAVPRRDLEARLSTFTAGARQIADRPASAEEAAKLASLGYLAGGSHASSTTSGVDPKDAVPLFHAFEEANQEMASGRIDAAVSRLESLLNSEPDNSIFASWLARALRKKGDLPRAIALFRRAVAEAPDDSRARYDLGVALQEAGDFDEARENLESVLAADATNADAHNVLGITLWGEGRLKDALDAFDRAAAIDPLDARTQNNRGNVLREMGRRDDAAAAYRRAIALAPGYGDPLNGLGAVAVMAGHPLDAIPLFERARALSPASFETLLNEGIALESAGRKTEALEAYKRFVASVAGDRSYARQRQSALALISRLESERK